MDLFSQAESKKSPGGAPKTKQSRMASLTKLVSEICAATPEVTTRLQPVRHEGQQAALVCTPPPRRMLNSAYVRLQGVSQPDLEKFCAQKLGVAVDLDLRCGHVLSSARCWLQYGSWQR